MDLSIVIPLFNEDESLPELAAWIERVVNEHKLSYEIIFVDDGSTDRSWEVIRQLRQGNPHIKGIKFQRNYGKSAALNEGFRAVLQDAGADDVAIVLRGGATDEMTSGFGLDETLWSTPHAMFSVSHRRS